MDATQEYFLRCLRNHIWCETSKSNPNLNTEELCNLAKIHDVCGIIYAQTKETSLQSAYFATLYHYARRETMYKELCSRLRSKRIPFVTVKGQSISYLYPVPALRTMGDIDILIHRNDQRQVDAIMQELGYASAYDEHDGEMNYSNSSCSFELHTCLIYSYEQVEKKEYIEFFNDFWKFIDKKGELQKEFHLLYLFTHLRKHLLNHGAGFRQFMDIAIITQRCRDEIDWNWFIEKVNKLKMRKFVETTYVFIEKWFDVEPPFEVNSISNQLFDESTQRIFNNGIFGFQSQDDSTALLTYDIAKYGRMIGTLVNGTRRVFPCYSIMRQMPEYSFVDNKPILLPVAWLWRGIKEYRNLRGHVMFLHYKDKKAAETSSRLNMIREWGM